MKSDNINPNQKDSESQVMMIKKHLLNGFPITPLDALKYYGCFRLGARIHDLKNEPHNIKIKKELVKTSTGKRVAEYSLEK